MSERLQIQIVSDFLCPFCKIASERAAWLEREFDAQIEWLPWDLHPEYPAEGIPRSELIAKYGAEHFANVAQMFEDCGFAYAPNPERVPNTHLALELGELARAAGLHAEYHDAVMVGMWEQELDVADPAVISAIAVGIGLDADAVAEAIESRRFRAHVLQCTEEAHSAGITGVPAFIFEERYLLMGAQPHAAFEKVIAQVRADQAEASAEH
ncbi:MAG: DsbA family oxidoreductase [Thermoleophilia bacterium]